MRHELHWDVLFVLEHDDLRRAADAEHFRRALELGRTLITLDHDFFDDRRFPPRVEPGRGRLLGAGRDRPHPAAAPSRSRRAARRDAGELPLRGRKVEMTPDVFAEQP